jgi:deoxyribodipyrimidine photo-lyase
MKTLFIFRRDLRIDDNNGLINAINDSKEVYPCFIFDKRQINDNEYFTHKGFNFMLTALNRLNNLLNNKLNIYYGIAHEVIEEIILKEKIEAVYVNRDYTPFSIKRDEEIKKNCEKNNVLFKQFNDLLLNEPEDCLKADNTPYTIFTPFYKNASKFEIKKPLKFEKNNFNKIFTLKTSKKFNNFIKENNYEIKYKSLLDEAEKNISKIDDFSDYDLTRNYPSLDSTTKFSVHLKFGTFSVREIFYKIQDNLFIGHPLIRQLYWRDFFHHIAFHFPHVFKGSFKKEYDKIKWEDDEFKFKAWKDGKTGFPIVDAGMRELNETGYMHNRVRMITASFLVKDLNIDWRKGEKYFAQKLIDYDPSLNNGNWQWSASTGCDAQPYFRIFNPWLQQKKFDFNCKYIKQWVVELKNVDKEIIHNLFELELINYPKPIVDHKEVSKKSIDLFKQVKLL